MPEMNSTSRGYKNIIRISRRNNQNSLAHSTFPKETAKFSEVLKAYKERRGKYRRFNNTEKMSIGCPDWIL